MPRESHIERQVFWKSTLQKYGCDVKLEKTVHIRGAPVIVDVVAECEEKKFLIEIGDIADKRKKALMQFYAENNPAIEVIHEEYGENKIQTVLDSLSSYRATPEFAKLKEKQEKIQIINEKQKSFNSSWTAFCFFGFIVCVFLPLFYPQTLSSLWVIAFFLPGIWFLGFIIQNNNYDGKKIKLKKTP